MPFSDLSPIKRQYEFDDWCDSNRLDGSLFVAGYRLLAGVFPRLRLRRSQRLEIPGRPPCFQSIWSVGDGGPESLVRVDAYECRSRLEAHEYLLRTIGLVAQSPNISRRTDTPFGDVAFSSQGNSAAIFARANVVFTVARAGTDPIDVDTLAGSLDEDLVSEPPPTALAAVAAPMIRSLRVARGTVRIGRPARLRLDLAESAEGPVYQKFFCSKGEIFADDSGLRYRGADAGDVSIRAYAVDASGTVAAETLRLTVEKKSS